MRLLIASLPLVVVTLAVASNAVAQDGRAAQGRDVAEAWCQNCHVIGTGDQPAALADAPSFQSLAERGDITAETLAFALLTPHPVMPSFPVTKAEIRALADYIASLAPGQRTEGAPPFGAPVVLASAADPRVEAGRALVETNCSPCHAVAGDGPSPVPDAPAFSTLSENYPVEHLEEALAEGITVNHPTVDMPQFVFQPTEIDAIIAYLASIQAAR